MTDRGCGSRVENALYCCVETSPFGKPIEDFLVDPVLAWHGAKTLRAPMLIQDSNQVNHVVLGIGKEYYPFTSDFVEETRNMGVSKRIPLNFDPSLLTPDKSKLLLVHARAIPHFQYRLDCVECPKDLSEAHECIKGLWQLSTLLDVAEKHHVEADHSVLMMKVTTPSATYYAGKPMQPKTFIDEYSSGIILSFPRFHFEYVSYKKLVPKSVQERIEKANFPLEVVDK